MSTFKYEKDQNGIVTITMDMSGPVNAMNAEYHVAMSEVYGKSLGTTGTGPGPGL